MKNHRYLAALLVSSTTLLSLQSCSPQAPEPDASQKIAFLSRPAIVRIFLRCKVTYEWYPYGKLKPPLSKFDFNLGNVGTGFLIDRDGYIVTSAPNLSITSEEKCKRRLEDNTLRKINRILVDDVKTDYLYNKDYGDFVPDYGGRGIVLLPNTDTIKNFLKPKYFKVIKQSTLEEGENIGQDITIIKIPVDNAPTLNILDISSATKIEMQERVMAVGYPDTADIKITEKSVDFEDLERIESLSQSSVVEGTISNTKKELKGESIIQIDIQSSEGSAGSPLINDSGKVIGMMAWVKPFDNSAEGTTIPLAIPIKSILQFINTSGVPYRLGPTDQYFHDGLELLWNRKYEEAKAKFLQAKALFPSHSLVDEKILEIDAILGQRYSKPWTNPIYQLIFSLVLGTMFFSALTYYLLRRKATAKQLPLKSPVSVSGEGNGINAHNWLELEYQGQTRRCPLNKDEHRLGRDPAWSDFILPSSWEVISRHHALLKKEGDDYRIYDGDGTVPSRNGLWIDVEDDSPVDSLDGYLLADGDQLKIGKDPHEWVILTYFNSTNPTEAPETKMTE